MGDQVGAEEGVCGELRKKWLKKKEEEGVVLENLRSFQPC